MMKKLVKTISLLLVVSLLGAIGSGCNRKKIEDTENNLIIQLYDGGYGSAGLQAVADAFIAEEKSKGNDYSVTIRPDPALTEATTYSLIAAGPKSTLTDMFFSIGDHKYMLFEGPHFVSTSDEPYALEEITDVYKEKVYGEDVTFGQKLNQSFRAYNEYTGYDKVVGNNAANTYFKVKEGEPRYYSVNWAAGLTGFAYNKTHFDENPSWELPVTTDELTALAAEIKSAGYFPFMSMEGSYYDYAALTWWRQCMTDEEVDDFWNAIMRSPDGTQVSYNSNVGMNSYERLQAFQLVEKYIGSKDVTVSGQRKEYAVNDWLYTADGRHSYLYSAREAQVTLFDKTKKVVFMPNGDWLENEMKKENVTANTGDYGDIGFMRFPVSSNVIYKVCKRNSHNNCTHDGVLDGGRGYYWRFDTVRSEAQLVQVIHAVDANEPLVTAQARPGLSGLTQAEYDEFKKIRSYTTSQGATHNIFIPSYSNAKDLAKKFLLFLASDEALQIYYNTTGTFLPFNTDGITKNPNATTFQNDQLKMMSNISFVSTVDSRNPLFFKTKLGFFSDDFFLAKSIATVSASDKLTGEGYLQRLYEINSGDTWNGYLSAVANYNGY